MQRKILESRPGSWAGILAVLALFVGLCTWFYQAADGQDLASSYVGSRLLIEGHPDHLFSYDPQNFAEIGDDDLWLDVAERGGFYGYLHPYVQTPLWAYVLKPVCRVLAFPKFNALFAFLSLLTFAATIWMVAKHWATSFFNPVAVLLVVVLLTASQPFRYAMFLNQTHMLFVFLTVLALLLAQRRRPVAAGFVLACAAAVKVTPALLVVYWLLTRRWKAAASTMVWSAVLWGVTVMAVGQHLMEVYLANLHRISQVLLLSQNNQSFAAWVMQHFYSPEEVWDINILPLPAAMRLSSSALMVLFTALGGWLDWKRQQRLGEGVVAPLGAMMGILAATIFAPIAWTHYSIVLFMPLMLLVDAGRRLRARWVWALIAVTLLLNYPPLATDINHGLIGQLSIVRGQFFAGLVALLGLAAIAWLQIRQHRAVARSVPDRAAVVA